MVALSPIGGAGWQFFDDNGDPLAGGKLYTYLAGTTTPAVTYTESNGAIPNTNPIILDGAGRIPQEVWLTTATYYKFVLDTSTDVTLWTKDNVPGIFPSSVLTAQNISYVPPFIGALTSNYTVADKLSQTVSVDDFGAVGDGIADDTDAVQAAIAAVATAGGGTVMFSPTRYVLGTILIDGLSNIIIDGNMASVVRPVGSGSNTLIFHIKGGSQNITIQNFSDIDGGYDSSNTTTGNNPTILVGDQSGNGDGGATNSNIRIHSNNIRRANWGAIVVYGRSNTAGNITPLNENIFITQNVISDCAGSAVFVYKNANNVFVCNNSVDTMAFNGLTFDTMAASDSVTSEPIDQLVVTGNSIKNFGKIGQGSGILVKGQVTNATVSANMVLNGLIQPSGSFANYGVLINKDADGNSTSNITVSSNTVKNIKSSLLGLGIVIGSAVKRAAVTNNAIYDCTGAGLQILDSVQDCTVSNNTVEQAGNLSYGYRFEGLSGAVIENLVVVGNVFRKSASTAVGGFRFDYVNNIYQTANIAPDFTSTSVSVVNSTFVHSLREFSATAAPTTGAYALGDIVTNPLATTVNPVDRWRCVVAGTPGTWRPVSWVVGRAPTVNRPVLTASDIGVTYLDTSLDADGKIISWNGTAWVDATGAVV